MKTVQQLATEFLGFLTVTMRDNGEPFVHMTDDAPQELKDLIHDAHEKMFHDDYKYKYVKMALMAIADSTPGNEQENVDELNPDIYNFELLKWLSSNLERPGFVDEATEQYGATDGIMSAIAFGQKLEIDTVANSVLSSLNKIVEEMAA